MSKPPAAVCRPEILAAVLDLDMEEVRPLVEERVARPIRSLRRGAMLTGRYLDINPEELRILPSRYLRIAMWQDTSATRMLCGIELTPFGDDAPWRKDYQYSEQYSERYSEQFAQNDSRTIRKAETALFQ